MNEKEYQLKIQELQQHIELLQKTNLDLVSHNLLLSQQINAYYDVHRRIEMLKELVIRHKELMRHADLRDDAELMALIETKLEEELPHENPDFGLKELAEYIGTTQTRLIDLFRRSPIHKTVDDYLDYLRLLRSMYYIQSKPAWGIAACAQQAGFTVIRTFNRKFQDAPAAGDVRREIRLAERDARREAVHDHADLLSVRFAEDTYSEYVTKSVHSLSNKSLKPGKDLATQAVSSMSTGPSAPSAATLRAITMR